MEITLQYNLDLDPQSRWNTISATAASKASLLYLQEAGDFICRPDYYTTREGFASYLIKFTITGCGQLNYQGQQYLVPQGHFFWIDCRQRQSYRTDPATGHWHTIWVHFYGSNAQFYYDTFIKQNGGAPVAPLPLNSSVYSLLSSLLEQSNSNSNQQKNDLISANLLHQLISECVLSTITSGHPDDTPQTILAIQRYLMQNYQEKLTLEEMGSRFNLNPFYLQKQFKRYIGQSPTEYLIYLRMSQAKRLIRSTHQSIGEIARQVGIKNLGYFTRLFKKQEGITPHEYSKLWPVIREADDYT